MALQAALRRIGAGLRTWPDARGWARVAGEAAWLFPLAFLLCWAGGLAEWQPRFDANLLKLALVAVLVPALGEEMLFRAALIPREEPGRHWPAVALSTAAFVAWHPLQVLVYGPHWAAVMLSPWFLAAVAAAGFAFARVWLVTGSVWASALLHWLLVVGWKALFAGPSPWVAPA